MITEQNYSTASIDDWTSALYEVYHLRDRKRSVFEMWLHLVQDASKVAEDLRKDDLGEACSHLSHVICWLFCLNAKFRDTASENNLDPNFNTDRKLSDIIFDKYPTVCWKCGGSPCGCPLRRQQIEKEENKKVVDELVRPFREARHLLPRTLDDWIRMFERIYGNVQYSLSIDQIGFHFMEEVGEVAHEIIKITNRSASTPAEQQLLPEFKAEITVLKKDLETETADVFSWITSLVIKLKFFTETISKYQTHYSEDSKAHTASIDLSKMIWTEYRALDGHGLICPECRLDACTDACSR